MMTGQQYKKSLDDNRETYFEGERVRDIVNHPLLGECVARIAEGYDKFYSPEAGAVSPLMKIPRSANELRDRIPLLRVRHRRQRDVPVDHDPDDRRRPIQDALPDMRSASATTFTPAAQRHSHRRVHHRRQGRSLPSARRQDDPDAYTRVVERRADGVVIRGAKLHITGASMAHDLMVIPTKAMKPGEEAYAIGCAVPVNSPGVKIIDTTFAPRHPDTRDVPGLRENSHGGRIRDPRRRFRAERAHLPRRRSGAAAVFAHSLGLWERLGGLSAMARKAPAGRLRAAGRRVQRPGRRRAYQGENLRDAHPRHP